MKQTNYNLAERLLHDFALGRPAIAELSFDLEKAFVKPSRSSKEEQHVFVLGLARAGTTMLMQAFFETGMFRSLTYRDMPFVLMPNLWKKLISPFSKGGAPKERAHGDGMLVDFDSPEALEDVFWRIFSNEYIKENKMVPHLPDSETLEQFRTYVDLIVNSSQSEVPLRYLSKNNNNTLRIESLRSAFPNAMLIIPFRNPFDQAKSLKRQHERFRETEGGGDFTTRYMRFLVHHEFGSDHRPFVFSDAEFELLKKLSPESLEYWLEIWKTTYRFLLAKGAEHNCVFVSYDQLCAEPEKTLQKLFALADIDCAYSQLQTQITQRQANSDSPAKIKDLQTREIFESLVSASIR